MIVRIKGRWFNKKNAVDFLIWLSQYIQWGKIVFSFLNILERDMALNYFLHFKSCGLVFYYNTSQLNAQLMMYHLTKVNAYWPGKIWIVACCLVADVRHIRIENTLLSKIRDEPDVARYQGSQIYESEIHHQVIFFCLW